MPRSCPSRLLHALGPSPVATSGVWHPPWSPLLAPSAPSVPYSLGELPSLSAPSPTQAAGRAAPALPGSEGLWGGTSRAWPAPRGPSSAWPGRPRLGLAGWG